MIGYRKRSFARAHGLLQTLRINPDDLATFRALQTLILREIMHAETQIRARKHAYQSAHTARTLAPSALPYMDSRIDGLRYCAYIWRCFGDGIAFLYLDKYALKQTTYNIHNCLEKQRAGFLDGKVGLANELEFIDRFYGLGIPALLVDITSTIRHGDICLMIDPDPYLIEIKTSARLNQRGKKQRRNLEKLRTFYREDVVTEFRGQQKVIRRTFEQPEPSYVDTINNCISEAVDNGHAIRNPEVGLYYIVITDSTPITDMIDSIDVRKPIVFLPNIPTYNCNWAPYMPFVLTIKDWNHLWGFIRGTIYIAVIVDIERLVDVAARKGYAATFDGEQPDHPFIITYSEGHARISAHMLERIGREFCSPEWIVLNLIDGIEHRAAADAQDRP